MLVPSDMSVDMTVDIMISISNVKPTFLCIQTFHKLKQQSNIEPMKLGYPLYTKILIVYQSISS